MTINRAIYDTGRLTARPYKKEALEDPTTGLLALGLDNKKDGYVYVPKSYHKDKPAALAVMLHGAGGQAEQGMYLLKKYANDHNILLLAPSSQERTWDIIINEGFGADVIYIDQALSLAFERYAIDTNRIAIGGFSDGASYALCLGLTNGDLFTHILAFSPGFFYTMERNGKPAVYISHGTQDKVLPINPCSRRIVSQLQAQELQVNYQEFEGAHEIPTQISGKSIEWFLQ